MNDDYNSVIALEDMCLVSYLLVMGFHIESIDSRRYPQVSFLFKETKQLRLVMENFFNGSALIEPKLFWAKTREIKARIKSIKN